VRKVVTFLWGARSPGRNPIVFGLFGTIFSRFTPPGPKKTLIIVGHAPLSLIPFSLVLLFTVPDIFSYHPFIIIVTNGVSSILFSFCMYQCCIALCDCIFLHDFQASFRCIPTIYTAYMCYNSLNFTGRLHLLAQCCLDDGHIKEYLLHIIWIHGKYHLSLITRMVIKGIRVSPYFIIACVCTDVPIVIAIMCCALWTYCVEIPMGYTKRILWLYIRKTPFFNMFTNCIHWVFFSKLPIRLTHLHFLIYYLPAVPVACGCLLVGSKPPWGPVPQ